MPHDLAERQHTERANTCPVTKLLGRAFLAAYLLTGSSVLAERAINEAIRLWNSAEEDEEKLFRVVLTVAVGNSGYLPAGSPGYTREIALPVGLKHVLELAPQLSEMFCASIARWVIIHNLLSDTWDKCFGNPNLYRRGDEGLKLPPSTVSSKGLQKCQPAMTSS